MRAKAQLAWRCQKHPWTKMTLRFGRNTRSGQPGSAARAAGNGSPARTQSCGPQVSGREFFERTRAMIWERSSGVSESTTKSYAPFRGASNGHLSAIYCSLASRTTHASDTFFWRAISSSVW